jgi:hypothetical protein
MKHRDPQTWIKASSSAETGNCAEFRQHDGMVEMRDSKQHGAGPILRFTKAEFEAMLDGVRKSEFDHLTENL